MYILVIQSDDRHVVDTVGPFNTESEAKHAKATIQVNPTFNRYCDGYNFTVMPMATVEATVESYETLWNDNPT